MAIDRLLSIDTTIFAAVCEYSPDGSTFYCGTYQLEQKSTRNGQNSRIGSLLVFENHQLVYELAELPGVLDVKVLDDCTIILALADGTVRLLRSTRFGADEGPNSVEISETSRVLCSEGLSLALAWANDSGNAGTVLLADADSSGNVNILHQRNGELYRVERRKQHDYEVWAVCWDTENSNILYSGADDSLMKLTDSRTPDSGRIIRGHDAGVTSIVSCEPFPSLLFTGSYDERFRVWDKRQLKHPTITTALGGGVWKIKNNPLKPELFACACMQGGARIVEFCSSDVVVRNEFMQDRQLVYGIDWSLSAGSQSTNSPSKEPCAVYELAACSFCDHVIDFFSFSYQ